jgi:hypothetical protein
MNLQIFNCPQGSPEWIAARAGIPTASKFATVMAAGRGGGESKTRRTYMLTLLGEAMTGVCLEGFKNGHTERGHELEPEARDLYAMIADLEPTPIGFMRRGNVGASPDSLVGDAGLLEIKTKLPHLQLDLILCDDRAIPEGRMSTDLAEVERTIAEISRVETGLAKLRADYFGVVYEVHLSEGLEAARAARRAIREPRFEVEKIRKAGKAPLLALGKMLDAEAARITRELVAIENPIDAQITASRASRRASPRSATSSPWPPIPRAPGCASLRKAWARPASMRVSRNSKMPRR